MPITGSDQALMYCQSNVERCGASRTGYHSPKIFVTVGGEHRATGKSTASHVLQSLSISETRSGSPNRASFQAQGWEPTVGMEVGAQLGSKNHSRRLFGGVVLTVNESNVGLLRTFNAECADWNWLLDGVPVYGHYTGTADAIALQLMTEYAPIDFTVRQVESGLQTVEGGITFKGVKLSAALSRLAKRVGVTQFVDYDKDLYFRVTKPADRTNPTDIVAGLDSLKKFNVTRDLSQIANRVPFEGGGSDALSEVAVGDTILPLVVAPDWWYGDVGGVVVAGPQKISYTARVEGGGGSLVGPGASPSAAPTLALADGAGVTNGEHFMTVVYGTAAGTSLPGPTASITVGAIAAPATAPTPGTVASGGSVEEGDHDYVMTLVTAVGETTPTPVSAAATVLPPGPAAAPTFAVGSGYSDGSTGAAYTGALKYAYVYANGLESALSPESAEITVPANTGWDATVPSTQPAGVTGRRLYLRVNHPTNFTRYANLAYTDPSTFSNTTGSPGNGFRDRQLAAPGTPSGVAKQTIPLTVAVSPLANVTNRKLYRRFNGTGTHKLVTTLNNVVTSYNDTTANSGLGADAPSANTATANQIALSDVPIGAAAVTSRAIYMSPAGGGTRRLALTIPNNTATTGTITISDATLAGNAAEPVGDTSGLAQPVGQVNPGATSLLVSGTAPFLDLGGWAFTGSQVIRYIGFSGSSLTGIPASGVGSIMQPVTYGTGIAAAPCLTGIPASGAGSILYTIRKGEPVNLFVTAEDTDAQEALRLLLDADDPVVRECPPLQDRRLNRDESLARANAFLTLRAYAGVRVGPYKSKDMNNRAGSQVSIVLTEPVNVNDTFELQSVTIDNFTPAIPPDYTVQASDELFSIEDLLNRDA